MSCPQCGNAVPALDFCSRCGFPLGVEGTAVPKRWSARRKFAAAPTEHAGALHVTSTLFPKLPDRDLMTFRAALAIGGVTILALAAAGLFPVGVAVSVALVPLLLALYLRAVDVYEHHPWPVLLLTIAWGIASGVAIGWWLRSVAVPITRPGFAQLGEPEALLRTVAIPVLDVGIALLGPLLLMLRRRRFNDVLDGATFGAVTSAALVAGQTLAQADHLFAGGLRPPGDTLAWAMRLLELGVLIPVLFAGAVGFAAGTLWLRFRSPLAHRQALGVFGHPPVGIITALALVVAAALAQTLLAPEPAFVALVLFASLALVALRRCLHVGLIEEAIELGELEPIECANCHRPDVRYAFCGHCGIARHALPHGRVSASASTVLGLVGGLAVVALVATVVVIAATPEQPASPCPARGVCGIPPAPPVGSAEPAMAALDAVAPSATSRFALNDQLFTIDAQNDRDVRLSSKDFATIVPAWDGVRVSVWVTSKRGEDTPSDLVAHRRNELISTIPFLQTDPDPATKVVIATVGRVRGAGGSFRGHLDTPQGPRSPVVAAIVAARRNGEAAVVSYVIAGTTDTRIIRDIRSYGDQILNSYEWEDER